MRRVDIDTIKGKDGYVWYACYGSNINRNRLMIYIDGDEKGHYADAAGCKDKSAPVDSKAYIIRRRLYFAKHSGKWNGGVAFLNFRRRGVTYGRIYKLRIDQFLDIFRQEHRMKEYDTVLYVGKYRGVPIYTFTAMHKLRDLEAPSKQYLDVIAAGIRQIYKRKTKKQIERYIAKIAE